MVKAPAIFIILAGLVLLPLSGCQTSQNNGTRDAKVDRELAAKKTAPSGQMIGEVLTEPQTGFVQEPETT